MNTSMNTVHGVQFMLARLDMLALRSCARAAGLRPRGGSQELTHRIMHRYASCSPERDRVYAAVRAGYLSVAQPVARQLAAAFEAVAGDAEPATPAIPPAMQWPALFSAAPPTTAT
jgi:hypothetical protein